jgi:hypothetical protein
VTNPWAHTLERDIGLPDAPRGFYSLAAGYWNIMLFVFGAVSETDPLANRRAAL